MKEIWFLLSTLLLSAAFVLVSSAGGYFPNGIVSESGQWFVISSPSARFSSSWNRGVSLNGYDQFGDEYGLIGLDYGYNVYTNNDYAFCDYIDASWERYWSGIREVGGSNSWNEGNHTTGGYSSCIIQHVSGQTDYSADWCNYTGTIAYYPYVIQ